MRTVYNWIFYLITPLLLLKLWRRGYEAPAYRTRIAERFGFASQTCPQHSQQLHEINQPLWIHAVSVGEVMAIVPVVKQLMQLYPQLPILMTTSTPTGADRVQKIFSDHLQLWHQYCPYDQSASVKRFIKQHRPLGLLIVETELWPNMLYFSHAAKIPIVLANARLSEKSARGYTKFAALTRNMLRQLDLLIAQSATDAERFTRLGLDASQLIISSNIKFDLEVPDQVSLDALKLRQKIGDRPVLILGSSHATEERAVLELLPALWELKLDVLLIIVPRHPERFDEVALMAAQYSPGVIRRSQQEITPQCRIYVADTMGELLMLYSVADLAIVGGSFVALGGQSPIEPASVAKGVLMGPHQYNFSTVCPELEAAGGLYTCENYQQLLERLRQLLSSPNEMVLMGKKAVEYALSKRGATGILVQNIEKVLLTHYIKSQAQSREEKSENV